MDKISTIKRNCKSVLKKWPFYKETYKHTINVVNMCKILYKHYHQMINLDNSHLFKLLVSAYYHDILKNTGRKYLGSYLTQNDIALFEDTPTLLHGPAASNYIFMHFNVCDFEILHSIYYHSVGSTLVICKMLFLADYLAKDNKFEETMILRKSFKKKSFDQLFSLIKGSRISYLIKQNIKPIKLQIDLPKINKN